MSMLCSDMITFVKLKTHAYQNYLFTRLNDGLFGNF